MLLYFKLTFLKISNKSIQFHLPNTPNPQKKPALLSELLYPLGSNSTI
jgi:hypothetical protein